MEFKTIIFYAFALVLVLAALKVITARNPVHSALFLVLAFFTASGIWMILKAEFLAIALVLVYVGAVMVLFLFVVMMLDVDLAHLHRDFWTYVPMASLVGVAIALEMGAVLWYGFNATSEPAVLAAGKVLSGSNTKDLGKLIYGDYVYAFEVAGVILLVAIVAAVALTLRRRKDSKSQDPVAQVRVKARDRVRIISMPAEVEVSAEPAQK